MTELDETDPAKRFETCFAPRCEERPVIYGRRYGTEPIQVFPACERHGRSYPIVRPEDLETFLEKQDAELVGDALSALRRKTQREQPVEEREV